MNHEFMSRPIPDLSELRAEKNKYRIHPISENGDHCILVNPLLCKSYYWHHEQRPVGAMEEIFLRRSLVVKLTTINTQLYQIGLSLLIQEGYRPLTVQKFVQEVSVSNMLKREFPGITDAALLDKVKIFAASPDMDLQTSPPPHLTGGAVDLTLVYRNTREPVDMGKSGGLYSTAFPDALEKTPGFDEAKRFRRLLFWLAVEQDIVTNPTEWWHLSWGDQMWAWAKKISHAHYGMACLPRDQASS
jgi:D-alanyl-D-alanine dipeptidase